MGLSVPRGSLAKARTQISTAADVWLATRMCVWVLALRMLKHVVPLPSLVRFARREPSASVRDTALEQQVITLARWLSRHTQPTNRGTCLEQALVTYRYLGALNALPQLVVGVATPDSPGKALRGHAWVSIDGAPVDDNEETLAGMVEIASFGPDGRRRAP